MQIMVYWPVQGGGILHSERWFKDQEHKIWQSWDSLTPLLGVANGAKCLLVFHFVCHFSLSEEHLRRPRVYPGTGMISWRTSEIRE
jgi:hypothetical protein